MAEFCNTVSGFLAVCLFVLLSFSQDYHHDRHLLHNNCNTEYVYTLVCEHGSYMLASFAAFVAPGFLFF